MTTLPTIQELNILFLTCAYAAGIADGRGKPWPPMDQASHDVAEQARAEYARYVAEMDEQRRNPVDVQRPAWLEALIVEAPPCSI